jgi:four helix bundle protein
MPAPPSLPLPPRARTLTWALDVGVDGDGDVAVGGHVGGACYGIRMLSFQKMDVYQRAIELLALASQLSSDAPRGNSALLDQLRRAASSIPLNIAEAAGRTGQADAARAYAIARGSAMECAAALDALLVLKVTDAAVHRRGCELLERIVAMLTKLCR